MLSLSLLPIHVHVISMPCQLSLQNIFRIPPFLTISSATILVQDAIISCLDYFNSLPASLSTYIPAHFDQSLLNPAVRVSLLKCVIDGIILLRTLLCLPILLSKSQSP